ncbi:MAG: flagellar protein FlgN [Gammaproteobacteria bacterium]|nr:flagellar protein FlgN [Gammaproteobacteria bacterium]
MSNTALKSVLSNIALQLTALDSALHDEFLALSHNELDDINASAELKISIFEKIEQFEQERCQLLQNADLELDSKGIKTYMLRHINDPESRSEVAHIWQEIENLTQICRRNNKINGIILEKNRQHTERALAILKGQIPETNTTYTATGHTSVQHQSHSFVKV